MSPDELHDFWLMAQKINPKITRKQSDELVRKLLEDKRKKRQRKAVQ